MFSVQYLPSGGLPNNPEMIVFIPAFFFFRVYCFLIHISKIMICPGGECMFYCITLYVKIFVGVCHIKAFLFLFLDVWNSTETKSHMWFSVGRTCYWLLSACLEQLLWNKYLALCLL